MNRIKSLTLCLVMGLAFSACKHDAPEQAGEMPATVATTTPAGEPGKTGGSYASPVLPDQNNPRIQLLLRTFWVAEYWVNHADNSQNKPNKGRWWRFNPDGTFTTGQWEQTFSNGSWVVFRDGEKELLHLDAADDNLDMEFELQAISQLQDYMSWVGTKTYKMNSIAVKATSLLTMPTKAQFGVTD